MFDPFGPMPMGLWQRYIHGDTNLTLDLDFLLASGTAMSTASLRGPALIFTRASNAMSFDSAGNLAYAPHQLLENANLSDNSDGTPSGWVTTDSGGKTYEDKGEYFEFTSVGSNDRQQLYNNVVVLAGETYTAGLYIVSSNITAGDNGIFAGRDTNGVDGDLNQIDFDALGGEEGWYAVGFIMGAADTQAAHVHGVGSFGNATGTIVSSRPFIVKGLLPGVGVNVPAKLSGEPLGRWIGTDDGDEPLYDQPRFAHDPADGNARLGLLMEEERTNVVLQSEDFDTTWTKTDVTVSTDQVVAPDGNTTMDNILETATTATHSISSNLHVKASSEESWTATVYVKAGLGRDFLYLSIHDAGTIDGSTAEFNITTGVISVAVNDSGTFSNGVASIEDVGGGIYRVRVSATTNADAAVRLVWGIRASTGISSYLGDVTKGMSAWGAGLEKGSFPTSYIPTTTASVTRAADELLSSDITWFNQFEGTIFVQALSQDDSSGYIVNVDDGSSSNRHYLRNNVNNPTYTILKATNTEANIDAGTITPGTVFKLVGTYRTNDIAASANGGAVVEDNAANMPVITTGRIAIGWGGPSVAGQYFNGYTQVIKYWNVQKPNAFLVSETA